MGRKGGTESVRRTPLVVNGVDVLQSCIPPGVPNIWSHLPEPPPIGAPQRVLDEEHPAPPVLGRPHLEDVAEVGPRRALHIHRAVHGKGREAPLEEVPLRPRAADAAREVHLPGPCGLQALLVGVHAEVLPTEHPPNPPAGRATPNSLLDQHNSRHSDPRGGGEPLSDGRHPGACRWATFQQPITWRRPLAISTGTSGISIRNGAVLLPLLLPLMLVALAT